VIQTQDANPQIRSGEVPRYTGIGNCFSRIHAEQGMSAFWRGNFTNCIRYFPTQAFNLSFKDSIKKLFPKYNAKTQFPQFFAVNMASGGMAAAGSLCIVYPLDYARTRLASDVGSGKKKPSVVWAIASKKLQQALRVQLACTQDLACLLWASSHIVVSSLVPLTPWLA